MSKSNLLKYLNIFITGETYWTQCAVSPKGSNHTQTRKTVKREVLTCHQAGPGMLNWKKFRALQTIERVFPGAIGTLNEQIHITHF